MFVDHRKRYPELGYEAHVRTAEAWRSDANHRRRAVVDRDRSSDDCRVPAEPPMPEVVAQHHDGRRSRCVVPTGVEPAAGRKEWLHYCEVICRRDDSPMAFRITLPSKGCGKIGIARDI